MSLYKVLFTLVAIASLGLGYLITPVSPIASAAGSECHQSVTSYYLDASATPPEDRRGGTGTEGCCAVDMELNWNESTPVDLDDCEQTEVLSFRYITWTLEFDATNPDAGLVEEQVIDDDDCVGTLLHEQEDLVHLAGTYAEDFPGDCADFVDGACP